MESLKEQTLGQIVSEDYRTADVFKKFGLDFCCGGKQTMAEACEKEGVAMHQLNKELTALGENPSDTHNYSVWSADFLVDYIVNNHHAFTRTTLPKIETYARKVARVHGESHDELNDILSEFQVMKEGLFSHLGKEEQILFPFIKQLVEYDRKEKRLDGKLQVETVENPVHMMQAEHDEAGESMAKIQRLSNNFTPPGDACTTYRVLFQSLEAFQDDLHKHVHLENNILFPKALELEKKLNRRV